MAASTPRGINYPTSEDKIKDGSSPSALADDFAGVATSSDSAITAGVQEAKSAAAIDATAKANAAKQEAKDDATTKADAAKQGAIDDATTKYGGLPQRMTDAEAKNSDQDTRLNIEESATRELEETAPIPTPGGFKVRDRNGAVALQVTKEGDVGIGAARAEQIATGDGVAYRIRDKAGAAAFQVTEEGNLGVGAARIEQIPADIGVAYRIRDKTGAVAFSIASNGTHSAGSGSAVTSVRVIIGAGQSNMTGVGTPIGSEYDFEDPRIFQYGSGASSITVASVPLDMHGNSSGLSPLTTFAREYIKTMPPGTIVLLVPAAHGGTGFSTPAPLTWDSATVGGLYDDMVAQTLEAVTAAQDQWGVVPTVSALLWHQGEGDGALTTAVYAAHLDALIAKFRTDISVPDLPVVVGQMSSDWVAEHPGPLRVQAAHIDTPSRVERTAFAASLPDTGREGDLVHFGRVGIEALGKSMLAALPVALANQEGVLVMPPTGLHAIKAAGVVTAHWEAPLCRATGYAVEYRIGTGAWTAATGRAIALLREQALPIDATEVRVSTINPVGNSRFTQPASVQGA